MLKSVYQHTLNDSVTLTGVGVHVGQDTIMTLKPAGVDTGITFIRTDITDKDNVIHATWDRVTETRMCTVVSNDAGVSVSTIEHLFSAFAAVGLDNVMVEINGPEIPIMDGSAIEFIRAIDKAGMAQQKKHRKVLVIKKTIHIVDGDKEVFLSPADGQYFSFEIDFDTPVIGRQKYSHQLKETSFRKEIASARTFGFLHEVEYLRSIGLAQGGSLENAIVINGDTILNPEGLRFKNEFVRHKILDAVGDLYLATGQMIGHYHGVKAGHAMNNKALHALFSDPSAFEFVELNQPRSIRPVASPAYTTPEYADLALA